MRKLYKIIATISMLVRQFVLPNPFNNLSHNVTVTISGIPLVLTPYILNWIAGGILPTITFAVVGIYYSRGEFPAWGSFLFMIFYIIHVGLLSLMALAQFATWAIVLIILLYMACHIGFAMLRNSLSGRCI
jgi:hypothetical protein